MPIPQGFIISTEWSLEYYARGRQLSKDMIREIEKHMKQLEREQHKTFGKYDAQTTPLFVALRSSGVIELPGERIS